MRFQDRKTLQNGLGTNYPVSRCAALKLWVWKQRARDNSLPVRRWRRVMDITNKPPATIEEVIFPLLVGKSQINFSHAHSSLT